MNYSNFHFCEKHVFFHTFHAIIEMMDHNANSLKLYSALAPLGVFSREEVAKILSSESKAHYHISEFLAKGYLKRIRRDLYALVSLETLEVIPSRYQIASKTSPTSYLYSRSALEYLGYANQVYGEIYFASLSRLSPFDFEGVRYIPILKDEEAMSTTMSGVAILTLEDSLIDYISSFEKIGGLEELLRALFLIPSLNEKGLLRALRRHDEGKLYQKTGYLLEAFREELPLSEAFFLECEKRINNSHSYFSSHKEGCVYFPRWKIYAPKNIKHLVAKGEDLQ